MRRGVVAIAAVICVLLLQPAAAQGWQKRTQEVRGNVFVSVYPDAGSGCIDANWRAGGWIGGPANGTTAYRFTLEPQTYGRNFLLEPLASEGADLDIVFVDETDPVTPKAIEEVANRGPGPEWGKVPSGADTAYVCLFEGSDAYFRFTAGVRVKPPKA